MDSSTLGTVNLGKSIIVPSVQKLVEEGSLLKIPPRYAILDQDSPTVFGDGSLLLSVPVIDLGKLVAGDSMDSELERLDAACKEWGFFQIVNHGVGTDLIESFKLEVKNLFKLPFEDKKKLWQQPDNFEGFGQLFVVSEEQKLDWSDMFGLHTLPLNVRNNDFFNKIPPILRETLETYATEMKKLAIKILGQIAKALKMDTEEMKELTNDGYQSMRMNYYPPCPEPEKAIGLTPHSDADILTILLQLNEIEGLQVRKEGKWIPVKPLPNAFVVNIGDMMEIVSNGVYRSIEHRATVNSTKERISAATFYTPKLDGVLGPAASLIGAHNPAIFRQVQVGKYLKEFFARKLEGKSYLECMRIEDEENRI
ncbi:hypothetical protein JCGZ_21652 [Jatropha curcas]|uniref:Fe2OG dioxygenase domain-containing protein n=1 Tax=Jatropha curcas TaxID=180498 RepID=A0A067JBK0_JATCU|nr:protein SRG1 [Jatropha curcas]KDP21181.1 hypothetical protein JCGZ_21652 [Jatropha curcas]